MIDIVNAVKTYNGNNILNNISVNFKCGKTYGIVGRNGSGKTVLLKSICGLIPLSKGYIKINNKIIGKDVEVPSNLGAIIESPGFLPNYSGFNNLYFLSRINKEVDKKTIQEVMEKVGLDSKDRKPVGQYSMGMKQRLCIAQAIMEKPTLLILDEPMSNLDENGVEEIRNLLLELKRKGITILMATHNLEDIKILCDCTYKIDSGKLTKLDKI